MNEQGQPYKEQLPEDSIGLKVTSELLANEKETLDQTLEPDNMEVHHHPQLHHKLKPWKEYLLEFLMIFLAVTMRYFAENVREHLGETKKETEYIKAL